MPTEGESTRKRRTGHPALVYREEKPAGDESVAFALQVPMLLKVATRAASDFKCIPLNAPLLCNFGV